MLRHAKPTPPSAHKGRTLVTLLMMLLTTTTAWANDITTNIYYNGLTASDVTFTLSGNGTSFELKNGETESVGDLSLMGTNFTITCTSTKSIDDISYSGTFSNVQDSHIECTSDGNNGCSFTWPGDMSLFGINLTLNITVTHYFNGYNVHFDGNGGTGTMSNQLFNFGEAQNLTANVFTREGYAFTGWNTAQNGSGSNYSDGQSVTDLTTTPGATVTLYAQWIEAISITQNGSVNMPASGGIAVNIPDGVTKFYVYDDGGPNGNFSDGCNGQMLLIAPEGTVLKVNGTVTGGWSAGGMVVEYARLAVYDGSSTSATMLYHNSYGSVSNIISSGKQMLLHFYVQ